jgi:Na+-driven multidrug efflux pump
VIVAGSAAAANIESFVYAAMNSFYQAAITFVGQNYGAGKVKRVDQVAVECLIFVSITGLVLGNLVYVFGRPLASIYAPGEPEVVEQALVRMAFICCPYLLGGIMDTLVGVLRGLGYSVVPMVVSLLGACVLRLIWVATVFPIYRTPATLYLSYPITWAVTSLVHVIFLLAIRKRAYAKVAGASYLATAEGEHPPVSK